MTTPLQNLSALALRKVSFFLRLASVSKLYSSMALTNEKLYLVVLVALFLTNEFT